MMVLGIMIYKMVKEFIISRMGGLKRDFGKMEKGSIG